MLDITLVDIPKQKFSKKESKHSHWGSNPESSD